MTPADRGPAIVQLEPLGVLDKLALVMADIGSVQKKGRNTNQNYDYVRAEDLYELVREKLAEQKVLLMPSLKGFGEPRETTTSGGAKMLTTTVLVDLTFIDTETGREVTCSWAGAGSDTGDKGIYKAFTGALKSFLMTAFLVPSDTDPDNEARAKRQPAGKLNKKDAETLTKLVKAYLNGGDETVVRLRLKQLGAGDVADIPAAAVRLSKDKATQLFEWLDAELVARQGAKA